MKKATFLVVAKQFGRIFCLLTSSKCDLDEVDKAMIQFVEWHFKFIFSFLTNRK